MLELLIDYFYGLFSHNGWGEGYYNDMSFQVGGVSIPAQEYFGIVSGLISFVVIFILCCLFIYRLIRLVGRLFSGGAL